MANNKHINEPEESEDLEKQKSNINTTDIELNTNSTEKNSAKKISQKFIGTLKTVLKPIKSFLSKGIIIAIIAVIAIIILSASIMYIWEKLTVQDTENDANLPGDTKKVMTADVEKDENGNYTFTYKEDSKNNETLNNSENNSQSNKNQYGSVDEIIADMTLEEKIYQMMMVQSVVNNGNDLKDVKYGGYIVGSKSNYQNNLGNIGSNYKVSPFVATDDEGGSVTRAASRFKTNARTYGDNKNYKQLSDDEKSKSGHLLGLGINLNLGPVTDVISDPNGALYQRSFSGDPSIVEECITEILEARKNSKKYGVSMSSALKHYPGYPDTSTNTDFAEATSNRSKDDIDKNIEVFKAGISSGAQSVMVSNIIYTNYDKDNPATLSSKIIGNLRKDFDGVIMTDDISVDGMSKQSNRYKRAIIAGNDMILIGSGSVSTAYNEINQAVNNGEISEDRINQSVKRILQWKMNVGVIQGGTSSTSGENDQVKNNLTSLDNFLFIGDSRTCGIATKLEALGNNIKVIGVDSSTPADWKDVTKKGKGKVLTTDVTLPDSKDVKGISVALGVNELNAKDLLDVVTNLQNRYKNVPIFVNSVYYVSSKYKYGNVKLNDSIDTFNNTIKEQYKNNKEVFYIDITNELHEKNFLKSNISDDEGIHISTEEGKNQLVENIKSGILNTEGADLSSKKDKNNNVSSNKDDDKKEFLVMTETITIQKNDEGEYCIATELDARVNEIYRLLVEEDSGALKHFDNDEDYMKKALRLWIIAEYSSRYLNLSSDVEHYKCNPEADYIQGSVKVKRYSVNDKGEEESKFLTYKPPEVFKELEEKYETDGDMTVFNHFTVDTQDNLVIAKYTEEHQESSWTGEEDQNNVLDPEYDTYELYEQKLNYRDFVKQYSMPFNLLWALAVYGKNIDFVNEVAQLVIDSEIVIGVRDNVTTTVTTTIDKYLKEEKLKEYVKLILTTLNLSPNHEQTVDENYYEYYIRPSGTSKTSTGKEDDFKENADGTALEGINESSFYEKTTINTLIMNTVSMQVEYIDSWFVKYEMEYNAQYTPGEDESDGEMAQPNTGYESLGVVDPLETSNYDEADKIINSDKYAPNLYKTAKAVLAGTYGADIVRNEITNKVHDFIYNYDTKQEYKDGVWDDGRIIDDIVARKSSKTYNYSREKFEELGFNDYFYAGETDEEREFNQRNVDVFNKNMGWFYGVVYNEFNADKQDKIIDEKIRAKYALITKENSIRTVNRTVETITNVERREFNKVETKSTEKTDKKKADNFVGILNKDEYTRNAYKALTGSTSSWFFKAISKNEDTQPLEDLMRYLFYKLTGNDYGVTEFDMSNLKFYPNSSNLKSTGTIRGDTVQAKVWFALKDLGYSDMQVAAAMGNFEHEAGFKTNNLEDTANKDFGYSDEEFTNKVNSGELDENFFVYKEKSDGKIYGYGLAQWSASNRKKGLYEFARSRGVSIDDVDMQVEYLAGELTQGGGGADGYATQCLAPGTRTIKKGYPAKDWFDATSDELDEQLLEHITLSFCYTFEKPGISAKSERSRQNAALKYYNEFHGKTLAGEEGEFVASDDLGASSGIVGTFTSAGKTYTIYLQTRGPWKDEQYYYNRWDKKTTISGAGCGMISTLNVASGFGGCTDNPLEFRNNYTSFWDGNLGWSGAWEPMRQCLINNFGADSSIVVKNRDKADMISHLQQGHPLIVLVHNYYLGSNFYGGHYFTILGISDDGTQVFVGDSGGYGRTGWYGVDEVIKAGLDNYLAVY